MHLQDEQAARLQLGSRRPCCSSVSVAPGAQVSTHAGSLLLGAVHAGPAEAGPADAGLSRRAWRAPSAALPGGTAYTMAWCAMATFCGMNWVPVRNAGLVRPGSISWHRYSSVPPSGGAGV